MEFPLTGLKLSNADMIRVYNYYTSSDNVSKNISRRFHNYINIAKEFLRNGYDCNGRAFHCCFAVDHGKVLTIGFNDYSKKIDYLPELGKVKFFDDPISEYRMGLHAEIDAILKLGKRDFSSISFFNIRIDRNFHCKTSAPCPNCKRMLEIVGAKNIYYFDDVDSKFKVIKL